MKISMIIVLITLVILGNASLDAASLDGTSSLKYQTQHYVFRDGDSATGLVRFANGFTIVPSTNHGSSATLDICITSSGGFDLRGTSTLKLTGDLKLDSVTTLTSSGTIYGYNRALVLSGDLTISSGSVLHLGGNLIIDGQGNDIFINEYSQFFLDNGATVTICNATIHNKKNSAGWAALALSTTNCRLTLSDVELALDSDFYINSGQVFIQGDVAITGTSALVWRSIGPCTIGKNSNLYFDLGTTFSYAPLCTNKDLIRMMDQSSVFQLNGCSLLATHTGLRLTQGSVLFDNRVVVDSTSSIYINSAPAQVTSIATGSNPRSCPWSPDGRYIVVIDEVSDVLRVFFFNKQTLTQVGSVSTDQNPSCCAWSPDGRYIAVVHRDDDTLVIFSFAGGNPVRVGSAVTGDQPLSVSWCSHGKYLAVGNQVTGTLLIYEFNGVVPIQVGSVAVGSSPWFCGWSPDGRFVAVIAHVGNTLEVYSFGGGNPVLACSVATGSNPRSCQWSPDGKYIALNTSGSDTLEVYSFNGAALSLVGSLSVGNDPWFCSWSPDANYLAVAYWANNTVAIYSFSGGTPTLIGSASTDTNPHTCWWSPDGKNISVTNWTSNTLLILQVNYQPNILAQAVTNGITFGNSSAGTNADINAILLSGARVEINGIVNWDAAA